MDKLKQFGWNNNLSQKWNEIDHTGLIAARVVADFGTSLKLVTPTIVTAELSGKMAHYVNRENVPKVGDWVGVRISDNGHAVIETVIPRSSEIARKVAGRQAVKQVIAANVDVAFVLLALDGDFSIERLKRFLYQLSINHISPVIVLNKADKTNNPESYVEQLQSLKLPVIVTSAIKAQGVDEIIAHIKPAQTAILLGSSGVGKSTITNLILGREAQATNEVRESDATGKHTTIHRELFMLPNGGMLIDTPGIRELQLWGTEEELDENFDDITRLASMCKYTTCQHGTEQGCVIQAALQNGSLDEKHYASFLKMKKELVKLKEKNVENIIRQNRKSKKKNQRQERDIKNDSRDD